MLFNVSQGISDMSAVVVRNHYNAYDVQVLRKVVTRPNESGEMGGMPNFGGVGVLDSNDENDYTYEFLCNAHAVKAEPYQPGNMTDRLDAPIGMAQEFVYMMVPSPEFASVVTGFKTKDIVLFVLGIGKDAARMAFEIATVDATCELPPYLPRYVLNRRSELDVPFAYDPQQPDTQPEIDPQAPDTQPEIDPHAPDTQPEIDPTPPAYTDPQP